MTLSSVARKLKRLWKVNYLIDLFDCFHNFGFIFIDLFDEIKLFVNHCDRFSRNFVIFSHFQNEFFV